MKRSEFLRAVDDEFGPRATSLMSDLVLPGLGRTAQEAIADGTSPREVWAALCEEADVPVHRRHGAGRLEPKRR